MRKSILSICCLLLVLALLPISSLAAPIDVDRECSLTIDYSKGGTVFPGLSIEIYRVAAPQSNGSYVRVAPFDTCPVPVNDITSQQEWREITETLLTHIMAEDIDPTRTSITDGHGKAHFTGLQAGLYLVKGVRAEHNGTTYVFQDFMIFLPTPTDSGLDYDCEAKPKYSQPEPPEEYTRYRVLKLWKDNGADDLRPNEITVEIYRNGKLWDTVRLHEGNHWSYSWEATDGGQWTVREKDVPDGYLATVSRNGATFTIINTTTPTPPPDTPTPPPDTPVPPPDTPDNPPETPDNPPDTPDIPKTGDTDPLWLYMMVMCISGLGLLLIGLYTMKRTGHAKK